MRFLRCTSVETPQPAGDSCIFSVGEGKIGATISGRLGLGKIAISTTKLGNGVRFGRMRFVGPSRGMQSGASSQQRRRASSEDANGHHLATGGSALWGPVVLSQSVHPSRRWGGACHEGHTHVAHTHRTKLRDCGGGGAIGGSLFEIKGGGGDGKFLGKIRA